MRIALFSDVHANLPALEAMFADMEITRPDMVYCLGDLVGYNVWPNEVVAAIRQRKIPVIAGNYDYGVGRNSAECGCAYKTDIEKENGAVSIAFTNALMTAEGRSYLRSLPDHIRLSFISGEAPLDMLLVHGSPRRNNEYLFEDREAASLLRIMEQSNAHILCFGHTHKPWHRVLADGRGGFRHAINTGSVGKPKDNDPRGCYVLVDLDENTSHQVSDTVRVQFIRFSYDVEKAAAAIEQTELPNAFADMLRKGY